MVIFAPHHQQVSYASFASYGGGEVHFTRTFRLNGMSNTDQTRARAKYHHGKCLSVTAVKRGAICRDVTPNLPEAARDCVADARMRSELRYCCLKLLF